MRLGVLALDYDGTLAESGVLAPGAREAVGSVRGRGIVVVLVTGRRYEHLLADVGDLTWLDAVVVENGAVVVFPDTGRMVQLGGPPPASYTDALRARGVAFHTGACIVEADAADSPILMSILREQRLPLTLQFNRGRVMVLPQGISKATGLREALRALRLSEHNTLAIGDAENDHALLDVSEVGVAVGWGSPALQAAADVVLPGAGPAATVAYIRQLGSGAVLPPEAIRRRALTIGFHMDGRPYNLAVRGRNVLIAGEPRSGKSWIAGLLAEQLILQRYAVFVLDMEGDYQPLLDLPGVIGLGDSGPPPRPHQLMRLLRYPDISVVVNLSALTLDDKCTYVREILPLVAGLRRRYGLPHRLVLDEAHQLLVDPVNLESLDLPWGGVTLATYRPAALSPTVLANMELAVLTRESTEQELSALAFGAAAQSQETWRPVAQGLRTGEALVLPLLPSRSAEASFERVRLGPRLTTHVRHREKYTDVPIPGFRAFIFTTQRGEPCGRPSQTLREFRDNLVQCPLEVLDGHLRRADISHWIRDVFGDRALADRIRSIEQAYQLTEVADARTPLVHAIESRYSLEPLAVPAGVDADAASTS